MIVVVEKPFTITSKEADQLLATQKETGKVLTVFQNRRYDSDFRTLRQVLDSGKLGEITEFQNHYDVDNPEWVQKWTSPDLEPGEGMLYGLGTHNLDQTLLLYGKPKSVTAFTRALRRESKTDDSFTVVLQYEGKLKNLICTVKTTIVSTLPMEKQLKFMVRGRDGTFIKVNTARSPSNFKAIRITSSQARRRPSNRPPLLLDPGHGRQIRRRARIIPRRSLLQAAVRQVPDASRQCRCAFAARYGDWRALERRVSER